MAHQVASRLALLAFAAAGAQGLLAFGDFEGTVISGLKAAAAFYVLGYLVGELGKRIAEEGAQTEFKRYLAAESEAAAQTH